MSVDYRSTAMIGCEVKNFDPDKNFDLYIARGLYWAQGGSYFSGDVDPYIVGLKKNTAFVRKLETNESLSLIVI